jgi:hypothetical protein
LVDLEDRGVREVGLGSGKERSAIGVIIALVVVLEVPPVDSVADRFGDGVVSAVWVTSTIIGEPGCDWSVSDNEF